MSSRETTPCAATSAPLSQSVTTDKQSALTSNPTAVEANSSNACNDMDGDHKREDVAVANPSNVSKPERRDDFKKRRTRRARKRKWRLDYRSKRLQWSESTEQEVLRLHMKLMEHGQPLAPYNTTQFIMNEHNSDKDIDFEAIRGRLQRLKRSEDHEQSGGASNDPNDEDFYSSPEDESDYLQQQFHEAYDNIHAERLSAMNKNELVQEYLQLEDRVEDLERKLKETTAQTSGSDVRTTVNSEVQTELCCDGLDGHSTAPDGDGDATQTSDDFKRQIRRLSEENQRLRTDNERLKRIVDQQSSA